MVNNNELIERLWNAERSSPRDLRSAGLTVAVHNDYRLDGKPYTFWLMTFEHDGLTVALKGEGENDQAALDQIRGKFAKLTDDHHHAPMCPANHYHGARAPVGPCNCGAVSMGVKMNRGQALCAKA